jgi:hypothetical protein
MRMSRWNALSSGLPAALSLAAVVPSAAVAHHGVSQYDMSEIRVLEGVVEEWDWRSPHTWLRLSVGRDRAAQTWEIEAAPPRWMAGQGWSPTSLAAGEPVSIMFHPAKRQSNAGILMQVTRSDGEVLKVNRPARLGGP